MQDGGAQRVAEDVGDGELRMVRRIPDRHVIYEDTRPVRPSRPTG